MGTRSLTVFMDGEKELAVLYRHMDGYPKGHGADLKSVFGNCEIVNGIGGPTKHRIANGMDCLAAQVIAHFKTGPGSIYLMAAGTRDVGEEFIYTLYCPGDKGALHLKVQAGRVTYFGDPGTKQAHMPVLFDGPLGCFRPEVAASKYDKLYKSIPNDFIESRKAEASDSASQEAPPKGQI
jgi:hypothetical protein